MERYVNFLENRLEEQHEGIAEQFAELDKKEGGDINDAGGRHENKVRIGPLFEATVRGIFGVANKTQMNTTSDCHWENEHKSRLNLADAANEWREVVHPEVIDLTQE